MKYETISEGSTQESVYYDRSNQGIRSYLARARVGNEVDYRTPLFGGANRETVLDRWNSNIEKLEQHKIFKDLYLFEIEMRDKVGPLSIQKPVIDRIPDVKHYYTDSEITSKVSPISKVAISSVVDQLAAVKGVRRRSLSTTISDMEKSSNDGLPTFRRGRGKTLKLLDAGEISVMPDCPRVRDNPVFYDANNGAFIRYYDTACESLNLNHQYYVMCAMLGWRGQEGGPLATDVKQRVIWMMPTIVNALELSMYQPFILACQKVRLIPAYVSDECVGEKMLQIFKIAQDNNSYVLCTDFSRFDQHFNPYLADAAKNILLKLVARSGYTDAWFDFVYPIKYNIPILVDDKLVIHGAHGMASGSGGTNFDETMAHIALQNEAIIKLASKSFKHFSREQERPYGQCLGDDGVFTFPGINVDDIINVYSSHGLEMNPDKQRVSKDTAVYLRRWYHVDYNDGNKCYGVYSTCRALGKLMSMERYMDPEKWSREMVIYRSLSILENCKYHPLFHRLINFVKRGDRFGLGTKIAGFFDDIEAKYKEAMKEVPALNNWRNRAFGEVQGIANWSVVKYLRSQSDPLSKLYW